MTDNDTNSSSNTSNTSNTGTGKEKHELASGLVDDQLSEIEIHRLLRRHDEATRDGIIAYGQIRAAARKEPLFSHAAHVDLHERIRSSIAAEAEFEPVAKECTGYGGLRRPVTGFAAAASLVVAVSAGLWFAGGEDGVDQSDVAGVESSAESGLPGVVGAGQAPAGLVQSDALPVLPASVRLAQPPSTELRELDPAKQAHFKAYLSRHDRVSRMNPNVRIVNFESSRR